MGLFSLGENTMTLTLEPLQRPTKQLAAGSPRIESTTAPPPTSNRHRHQGGGIQPSAAGPCGCGVWHPQGAGCHRRSVRQSSGGAAAQGTALVWGSWHPCCVLQVHQDIAVRFHDPVMWVPMHYMKMHATKGFSTRQRGSKPRHTCQPLSILVCLGVSSPLHPIAECSTAT